MDIANAVLLTYPTALLFAAGFLLRWVDIPKYWIWCAPITCTAKTVFAYYFLHQHKSGDDKDVHKQHGRLPKVSWICHPWQACQDWFVPISGILVILNMHGQR